MDSGSPVGAYVESNVKVNLPDRTVQESRRLIDEQITLCERSILQLKFQRNELASVSRLPPEVFGTIFAFASAASARLGHRGPSSWFNFSHVCRLWRNVALTTPSIWCFIPLHYQQWATAMLERSKSADLGLDLQLTTTFATSLRGQFMKNILENHTSRIRELSLTGLSSSTLSILLEDIPPSSFRLRSLQLAGGYDQWPRFPASIIANSEGLRELDVARCDIAWCSMPLTGLTSLKMVSNPTRPLWLDFITALGGMPSLATLEMQDSFPLANEHRRRTKNPIKLTKLRQLSLCSRQDMNEVINVLSSIVVPQGATIKIGGGADNASKNDPFPSDASSSLSAFISEMRSEHGGAISYQTLLVNSVYGEFSLEAWKDNVKTEDRCTIPANLELSIYHLRHTEKMLRECNKHLPLSGLKSLHLSTDLSKAVLMDCFGNLPQLRNVTLSRSATHGFINVLIHKAKGYNRRPKVYYDVTLPALESLEIVEAIFSPDHGGFSFEELQDCLMERCNRKAEIRKLTLSDCFCLYKHDVDLLREIVVDVDWDEWEEEYNSEDDDEEDMYSECYSDDYSYGDGSDLDFMVMGGF